MDGRVAALVRRLEVRVDVGWGVVSYGAMEKSPTYVVEARLAVRF